MIAEKIGYRIGDEAFEGVIVYDDTVSAGRPVILLAPDWMGVSDTAIASARRIAGGDYIVFVADMYGVGIRPDGPDAAAALAGPIKSDIADMRRRVLGALAAMQVEVGRRGLGHTTPPGAVGFCFGGQNVLELVRTGTSLSAAVSIHGDLATANPARPGDIRPALLVLHGAADPIAPKAQRDAFEAEMDHARARWSMMVFGGAVHSFTDPGAAFAGVAMFDEVAARWAFQMTAQFLHDAYA